MTKFIHIGDIHAGKSLQNKSRNDDVEYAISQVIDFAKKENIDFVILAGDIFDQYNPDTQAIKIIFDYMVRELNNIPIVMITGNHDSQAFFDGYKTLAKYANIHIFNKPSEDCYITIKDTTIIAIPFISPKFLGTSFNDYASKLEKYIDATISNIISKAQKSKFKILTTHVMASGSKITNSERKASVSDFYAVNLNNIKNLSDLNYVALGHVHRYQKVETITECYYTGSCFQIDFSERGKESYFNYVILEEHSLPKIEPIKLNLKNELRIFEISLKDMKLQELESLKGYAKIIINDTLENTRLLEEKLKSQNLYHKILEVQRRTYDNPELSVDINTIREQLVDFYALYFKEKYHQELPQDLMNLFLELQNEVEHPSNP